MKTRCIVLALLLHISVASLAADAPPREGPTPQHDMTVWYRQPAQAWMDAMPLGNGLMGAMVFGDARKERIALNESSFWSGRPHDYDDPEAGKYFTQVRDLVFAGKFQEAEKLAADHFWGIPKNQQAYQPIGDLSLTFGGVDNPTDYRRELDMENGVAKITYRVGDAMLTREAFISYPDRVMVVRITADKPGRVSAQAQFTSSYLDRATATTGKLVMDGSWKGPMKPNGLIATVTGTGERFQAALVALAEGGRSEAGNGALRIQDADSLTLIVAIATSFTNYHDISGDPAARCDKVLAAVNGKDYATLRRRHEEDFRGLMGRVHLNIGDADLSARPTDERLDAVRKGGADANLEALCFQFGRYALVSSSRAGGQPANLQGIWNADPTPNWGSKYTVNINTEMNYWPTEVCNLSECHQPLFDMLKDIAETGAKTAKVYYGVGGWVCHHNIDLWRGTAPVDGAMYGMWPVGGAWLCQDIWEHYAFTGDQQFLKEHYPIMRGSAQFLLGILTEDPKYHWLVTPFSMSPEHGYFDSDNKMSFLSPMPTMDLGIIRELFPHVIAASRILGVDDDFRAKLEAALPKLPPYQVSKQASPGNLQEWIEDWRPGPQGHNCSANFPFYPGNSITLRGNPGLAAAIAHWMETRRPGGGFPSMWYISIWSRLERGDKAAQFITGFVSRSAANNLHNRGANQSDATFGYTAGVAEALIQSHAGEISLLPALPSGWVDGSVTGLRARGQYVIDITWKGGKLVSAVIHVGKDGPANVRYKDKTATLALKAGGKLQFDGDLVAAEN